MTATMERTLSAWQQVTASVDVAGNGPPLVFFHGEGGLQWSPFLDELARTHTVYAPRHPGTRPGDPEAIRAFDHLWDLVLYYADVFEGLGLEQPVVVGHAFGGMVAAELAASYPCLVGKLVLINPVGLWREDAPVRNWMAMKPEALLQATFSDPAGPLGTAMRASLANPAGDPETTAAAMWSLACTGRFVWPIPDKGLAKRLYRIKAPTLLLWGRDDGLVPMLYANEFAARLANAKVRLIDGAGHLPHLEQTDEVVGAIEAFVAV